jgi:hypothetical protein
MPGIAICDIENQPFMRTNREKQLAASADVLIESGEGDGDAGFREIEDGVLPGEGFPMEARAVPAVKREQGGIGFRRTWSKHFRRRIRDGFPS